MSNRASFGLALGVLALACNKSPAADAPAVGAPSASASASASVASRATAAEEGCPKDLLAAKGSPCATEGKTCREGTAAFTHLLMCSGGKWTEMDAPPPPPPPQKK